MCRPLFPVAFWQIISCGNPGSIIEILGILFSNIAFSVLIITLQADMLLTPVVNFAVPFLMALVLWTVDPSRFGLSLGLLAIMYLSRYCRKINNSPSWLAECGWASSPRGALSFSPREAWDRSIVRVLEEPFAVGVTALFLGSLV